MTSTNDVPVARIDSGACTNALLTLAPIPITIRWQFCGDFDQDATDLACPDVDVVGPFDGRVQTWAELMEGLANSNSGRQRDAWPKGLLVQARKIEDDRKGQRTSLGPPAIHAATSAGRLLITQHKGRDHERRIGGHDQRAAVGRGQSSVMLDVLDKG